MKLAKAMEKIFGSNEMPEDLAGEHCTSKHEEIIKLNQTDKDRIKQFTSNGEFRGFEN